MKTRSVLLPSLAAVLLAAIVGHAAAAEDEAAKVIRFGRIFVPADRLKDWPIGDGKYLPVDAAEFDRLAGSRTIPQPRRSERPGGGDHLRAL